MQRVAGIVERGEWDPARAVDAVSLDASDRNRRRIVLTTQAGKDLLLDFAEPIVLRNGDGLVLDDRSIVRVIGAPEPVLDVHADDAHTLARLAWHLGNRHTEVQILNDGLRIRYDHVLEDMLKGLGAQVERRDAPFDPESGAYAGHGGHHHPHGHGHGDHGHAHDHDHAHDHHDHAHGHGHHRHHAHPRERHE